MAMVPTECRMPSLHPELERLQPRLLHSLTRQPALNQIPESQRSYEEMLGGRIIYTFGFTDHMENHLNAARRALDLLQYLRADLSAPAQDRIRRRLIEAHADSLVDVRNGFEHVGSGVNNNEFAKGEMSS